MAGSAIEKGLRGSCPNCGEGRLFDGFLKFARSCEACGLNFDSEDTGDGPAVFVILLVGIFIIPLALVFQMALDAPFWLVLIVWGPIVIITCLLLLRVLRGVMFNLQFKHKALEVRSDDFHLNGSENSAAKRGAEDEINAPQARSAQKTD